MDENLNQTVELSCPSCDANEFELRALSDEGLASARCAQCARTFLLLDSEDYWFDAIQSSSPRVRRCSCKTSILQLTLDYLFRSDSEVKSVDLWSQCPSCKTTKRQMHVDIDYTLTDDLVARPLRYCENPSLRYDLKEISLYVDKADLVSIIRHLGAQREARVIGSIWENDRWVLRSLDLDTAETIVLTQRFSNIYVSFCELNRTSLDISTAKKEEILWKRHELIRFSSPLNIRMGSEEGSLWYIHYSNEFVQDGTVVQKGDDFREATSALLRWLNANFANWRGKLCFDNPAEHVRLFGDRFTQIAPAGERTRR